VLGSLSVSLVVAWRLFAHNIFLHIPILRMSFVDDDSLSLAGLDAPDFLQLDDSFSSATSSLTVHCHSLCTTPTCMRDSGRRSPKGPQSPPLATTEMVRIDIHVRQSVPTSHPAGSSVLSRQRRLQTSSTCPPNLLIPPLSNLGFMRQFTLCRRVTSHPHSKIYPL